MAFDERKDKGLERWGERLAAREVASCPANDDRGDRWLLVAGAICGLALEEMQVRSVDDDDGGFGCRLGRVKTIEAAN